MSVYNYNVKVVLIGDDTEGMTYLASRFSNSYFEADYKYTIGVDIHVKVLSVFGRTMKMLLWELLCSERLKSLAPMYYRGAMGAIIIFDISKSDFQNDLEDTIQLIREGSGDIPIVLLTFKNHLLGYVFTRKGCKNGIKGRNKITVFFLAFYLNQS